MSKENLKNEIEKLRNELNQISTNQPESIDRLNTLLNELEDRVENDSDDDSTLIDNIKDYISRFETEHPRTTAILNDIMVTLSNMGI